MTAPQRSSITNSSLREVSLLVGTVAATVVVVGGIAWLLGRAPKPDGGHGLFLPSLNASLNAATTVCLLAGWRAIRRRQIGQHRAWMLTALFLSALFLTFYVVHHYQVGSVRFVGPSWLRIAYFAVLVPHIVLSAVMVPFVLLTVWRALQENFSRHRQMARWTLPMWLVVSVTGVLVYGMLYHLGPLLR